MVLVVGALVVVALFLVALAAFVFVCLGLYRNKKTGLVYIYIYISYCHSVMYEDQPFSVYFFNFYSQVELERIELPNTEALGAGMFDNQW